MVMQGPSIPGPHVYNYILYVGINHKHRLLSPVLLSPYYYELMCYRLSEQDNML